MTYRIYVGDELRDVCTDCMDAVSLAVGHYRDIIMPFGETVTVTHTWPSGEVEPYDWERAYRELCNQ